MNCHPGRRRTVSNALDRKEHRSLPNVARVPDGDIHQLIGAAIPATFWERYVSDDTAHMGFATSKRHRAKLDIHVTKGRPT